MDQIKVTKYKKHLNERVIKVNSSHSLSTNESNSIDYNW